MRIIKKYKQKQMISPLVESHLLRTATNNPNYIQNAPNENPQSIHWSLMSTRNMSSGKEKEVWKDGVFFSLLSSFAKSFPLQLWVVEYKRIHSH